MPLVVVLSTGGTISSRTGGDAAVVSTDGAAELVGRIAVGEGIVVEAVDVLRTGSYQLDLADLRTVHDAVVEQLDRPEVHGVVLTHGTDTLEETAALLDLVHDDSRPIVLTGAQRSADTPDGDGPCNLRDAVTVAASPTARDLGVLIVFAGAILAARGTRKMHTTDASPFRTLDGGPLGTVAGDDVRLTVRPERPKPLPRPTKSFDDVRVDLVALYPGADSTLLDASVAAGARGIVLAASGIGNANNAVVRAVAEHTTHGVVVALSSRVPEGPVVPVYGDGGGVDLVRAGAVVARELPSFQTRVLLCLLLSLDLTDADVRSSLETYA